jgi:hypothetical protein
MHVASSRHPNRALGEVQWKVGVYSHANLDAPSSLHAKQRDEAAIGSR